jgi:NAD(P)-dependent dehydrogenase (short-subunit alcohol dehydrogenase family)
LKVLITGAAGFIGPSLALCLLERGDTVIGIDNHNNYYDPAIKEALLTRHASHPNYNRLRVDLADRRAIEGCFATYRPQRVVNLAAQAGVRYPTENPLAYIDSNIVGFAHILEGYRHHNVEHLVYASSSSAYGANTTIPFSVHHNVDHPLSLYGASKKRNELMAHAYSHLYDLPTTGLRFFTVYGHGAGPTWICSSLPRPSWQERRSPSITAGSIGGISPTSTTSSKALSGFSTVRHPGIPTGTVQGPIPAPAMLPSACTTWATAARWDSWNTSLPWRRHCAKRPRGKCYPFSRATFPTPTRTSQTSLNSSTSNPAHPSSRALPTS